MGYSIVAMGRTLGDSHVDNGFDSSSFWYNDRYCQTAGDLEVESEMRTFDEDPSQKTVFAEGAAVTMKRLARPLSL